MLVSGHKRIKACKYNIEHESELDGTGKVQKTIVATIVKKPDNEIEEMNTILTYNDYRRFDTEEKKYTCLRHITSMLQYSIKTENLKEELENSFQNRVD